jgi:ribonuclease HI
LINGTGNKRINTLIFTDASYSPASKRGVGGYLSIRAKDLEKITASMQQGIVVQEFSNVTISMLELETAMLALRAHIEAKEMSPVILYTDCKNIVDLPRRRVRLEKSGYISKRSGKLLAGAAKYQEFFALYEQVNIHIVWVRGHVPEKQRSSIDKVFALLDQSTRAILRG